MTLAPHKQPVSNFHSSKIGKQKQCKHDPTAPRTLPLETSIALADLINYNFGDQPEANVNLQQQELVYQEDLSFFNNDLTVFDHDLYNPIEENLHEDTPSIDSGSSSDSFELKINNIEHIFEETDSILRDVVKRLDDKRYKDNIFDIPLLSNANFETIDPLTFNLQQNNSHIGTDVGRNGDINNILPLDSETNPNSSFCADYHPEVQWNEESLLLDNDQVDNNITPAKVLTTNKKYNYTKPARLNINKASRASKQKRARPQFSSSKELQQRIDNYFDCIADRIDKTAALAKPKMHELGYRLVDASYFKNNIITPLLPNNAELEDFKHLQGVDGFIYEYWESETSSDLLSLRWSNQRQNFYEPKIVRYRISEETGNLVDKEALCPYCPVDITNGLDKCFHNINMSHYMHHVCKNHGVFSTGEEMPVPAFCEKDSKYFSYCSTCGECQKLSIRPAADRSKALGNGLISYFRHQYKSHNRTRKMRNSEEKKALFRRFNGSSTPLVYEKEII